MTDKRRMSRETKAALDGILKALAEHGFELPYQPVAPGGEWASNWCNRDALADALDGADVAVPVVPLERVEKAEAAARDLAQALVTVQSAKTLRGVGAWATPVVKQAARDALARHPEYAPTGGSENRLVTTPYDDPIVQACVDHGGHFWPEDTPADEPPTCTRCWFNPGWKAGKPRDEHDLRIVWDDPRAG